MIGDLPRIVTEGFTIPENSAHKIILCENVFGRVIQAESLCLKLHNMFV